MHRRAHPKFHAPEYAAQPPHILVFEVRAVAPTVNLHGKAIFALAQIFGNVKLRRGHRILAVTDLLPVYPNIHRRMYAAKMQYQIFAQHIGLDVHKSHVRAYGIAVYVCSPRLVGRFGCYARTVSHKGVIDVDINRRAEALRLPIAGDIDLVPTAHIVILAVKIRRTLIGVFAPMKQPLAIERNNLFALPDF